MLRLEKHPGTVFVFLLLLKPQTTTRMRLSQPARVTLRNEVPGLTVHKPQMWGTRQSYHWSLAEPALTVSLELW